MTLVPDYRVFEAVTVSEPATPKKSRAFWTGKRAFDLFFTTIFLLPATILVAACLLVLNPIFNPGPLLFSQKRMGQGCRPFRALKFRTMEHGRRHRRGPNDPVEFEKITPLGLWLRRLRFDELPQIWNVYRGEMSLIGPRPDTFRHAHHYMRAVPGYAQRYSVRPGISGLAQIELGYAEGTEATRRKTATDIVYIRQTDLSLETQIFFRTIGTVVKMRGN